ncbi:MAG: hypothetical protein ACFFE4_06310 [Candidatus Thorarchaeota archaeon]
MTITFYYRFPNVLEIILFILTLSTYIFLIYGGKSLQKTRDEYLYSNLFIIGGIVGIILFVIRLCLPGYVAYNITEEDSQIIFILTIFFELPFLIRDIVVFGAFFIIIGVYNKEKFGKMLLSAGILFISSSIIFYAIRIIFVYSYTMVLSLLSYYSSFLLTSAMVVFLIYNILIEEKTLMISAICLIAVQLLSSALILFI